MIWRMVMLNYKKIIAVFITFVFTLSLFGSMTVESVDDKIMSGQSIQEDFSANGESTEGGEYSLFKNTNGAIIRIDATVYGETGNISYKLYFLTNARLFVKERLCAYDEPLFYNGNTNPKKTCRNKEYETNLNDEKFSLYTKQLDENVSIKFIELDK